MVFSWGILFMVILTGFIILTLTLSWNLVM
uniref:Uncharacterized protein n=1 Tax=Arundo donax TaxID=35708 RepID=A0A0A9BCT1_ARUDO